MRRLRQTVAIIQRTIEVYSKHDMYVYSGYTTFYFLMSVVPLLMLIISVIIVILALLIVGALVLLLRARLNADVYGTPAESSVSMVSLKAKY